MFLGTAGPSRAQSVSPNDFAYGVRVDTVGKQPVQAFVAPQTVYEHLTLKDLGDVRIFNGAGIPVPHAVHRTVQQSEGSTTRSSLPIFPLYGRPDQALGNLNVRVRRDQSGTLIQLDERAAALPAPLRAYLVDASGLDRAVDALFFEWEETPQNLVARITVETSEDLIQWQSWGAPATLASMQHGDQVLVRNSIDMPARTARYYRISWPAETTFPPLSQLDAVTAPTRPDAERYWLNVLMTPAGDGVYVAEISPGIPFDRLIIDLPEPQRIVRVRLTSSEKDGEAEIQHFQGLAYHLRAGDDAWRSPAISIDFGHQRYWILTVFDGGASLLGGAPTLRIGWTPARVLFVPQGEGPFTLAYGNASAEPTAFTSEELFFPIQHEYRNVFDVPLATTGAPFELGGAIRLERVEEVPWARFALWGSLIAGVALLALLSLRLLKNVDSSSV